MTGFTERPAFLQFFQIIMVTIALSLELYAFSFDLKWNSVVDKHKVVRVCSFLTRQVDKEAYTKLIQLTLDDTSVWDGDKVKGLNKSDDLAASDMKHLSDNLKRSSAGEQTAIILLILALILLIVHLFFACSSSNYEYRTKWAAASQGLVIFFAGFAAIFLAISAHSYDERYQEIADKFVECKILVACRYNVFQTNASFTQFLEKNDFSSANKTLESVTDKLEKYSACQEFTMKIGSAIICGVTVILCCLIICNAMELTTIYDEEDVDEEERARRQAFHSQALHAKRKMHKNKGGTSKSTLASETSKSKSKQNIFGRRASQAQQHAPALAAAVAALLSKKTAAPTTTAAPKNTAPTTVAKNTAAPAAASMPAQRPNTPKNPTPTAAATNAPQRPNTPKNPAPTTNAVQNVAPQPQGKAVPK